MPRQRRGITPQMIGRYPDYDVFDAAGTWDAATARVIAERMEVRGSLRVLHAEEQPTLRALCDVAVAQDGEPRIPVAELIDEKLAAGRLDGYQYADMPDDRETWRLTLAGLDEVAAVRHDGRRFGRAPTPAREAIVEEFSKGQLHLGLVRPAQCDPGLVGVHAHDPGRLLLPSLGLERDRLRRTGVPARVHAPRADEHPRTLRAAGRHRRGPGARWRTYRAGRLMMLATF